MADLPNFDDLFRIARDEVLVRNGKLSRESVEREGTDANILLAAAVAADDEVIGQLTDVEAALYLDSATGQALDRLVFDRYGILRKPAAPALGSVSFSTTAPNPAAFNILSGTTLQTADGLQYVTTSTVTFPIASVGPVLAPVRSVLAGVSQQAKVGTITNIVSAIPGQSADLAVTNAIATSGADDEESDGSLRNRARLFFTTARRGTLAAVEAGALAVEGVRTAKAFEVLDALGRPARLVLLMITDAYTDQLANLDAIPPAYQTQSQQLVTNVFNGLSDVRPAGTYVQVQVASTILLPVQLALTFNAGVDVDFVALQARAAIVNHVNERPAGAFFSRTAALDALRAVAGLVITGGEIASPPGDVVVKPLQVLRTTLSLVIAASVQAGHPLAPTVNPDTFVEV